MFDFVAGIAPPRSNTFCGTGIQIYWQPYCYISGEGYFTNKKKPGLSKAYIRYSSILNANPVNRYK